VAQQKEIKYINIINRKVGKPLHIVQTKIHRIQEAVTKNPFSMYRYINVLIELFIISHTSRNGFDSILRLRRE